MFLGVLFSRFSYEFGLPVISAKAFVGAGKGDVDIVRFVFLLIRKAFPFRGVIIRERKLFTTKSTWIEVVIPEEVAWIIDAPFELVYTLLPQWFEIGINQGVVSHLVLYVMAGFHN